MVFHALLERLWSKGIAILVLAEPFRTLAMPYQAMADGLHIIIVCELYEVVSLVPVPCVWLRMYLLHFHTVLCYDAVEMLSEDSKAQGIFPCHL